MEYTFQKARVVWGSNLKNNYNQFLGFYRNLKLEKRTKIKIAVAARSYYRLYINGKIVANGPARTAKNYCRVDVFTEVLSGKADLAFEVAAYDKPGKYCNDCTLERGILIAEITDCEGNVLAYTGDEKFQYIELLQRRSYVETMSHSRGIVEYYDLDATYRDWTYGKGDWVIPEIQKEEPGYLIRRAPYPTYRPIEMQTLLNVCDMIPTESGGAGFVLDLARAFNHDWYEMIPKENEFLEALRKEKDGVLTGSFRVIEESGKERIILKTGKHPTAVIWKIEKSEIGFLDFEIKTEKNCILDVINSDHMHVTGELRANSYVTRYCLQPGVYHLTTFEPKLVRFVKMIFRTEGEITVSKPVLLDDSYPDNNAGTFVCNDGDLNRIYEAARRTLRLSTLDIFMDCPQRERGGWLCDSYFSAIGAWHMFGSLGVEKDFIENFMLTDPDEMSHAFFPEVYPGSKPIAGDVGIRNWSFWLMLQLADYYHRSGDWEFIEKWRYRVTRFVDGVLSYRGESGLLEGFENQFVDWSMSNRSFALQPISIPNNCLAVYMLELLSELYKREDWKQAADEMRMVIEKMDNSVGIFGGGGDGAVYENGCLRRTDCPTESGLALEIFSGFHTESKATQQKFTNYMGVNPKYRPDPNVGKSNVFIGLMIRFEALVKTGKKAALLNDLKSLYLPELRDGSGTFFENYQAFSGCHGFNGAAGALITSEILGLGAPEEGEKKVQICPFPGELSWAYGSEKCSDGTIFLHWSADQEEHVLQMYLTLPEKWTYILEIPFELSGWKVTMNGETFINNIKKEIR